MNIKLDDIINRPFTFTRRKEYLPCEMRPLWRCSLILIIFLLLTTKKRTCSLKKLYVINWLLKSDKNVIDYSFWVIEQGSIKPEVRMDPMLDKAIELLLAEELLVRDNEKIKLTKKGELYSFNLLKLNIFEKECDVLNKNKKYLTETNINKLFQVE
ncbi:serine/threonine protein kinase [Proteus cibi]|uniref:serine/threonine protein kinase n=1 Tax=Proteus cibi TaxID=2050966 RepID=UPI000D69ACFF|nr:serine/threonine protein kinase [Proteus cibi]